MRKILSCVILSSVLITSVFSPAASAEQASVTGDGVNVRTGPGTAYGIFASLDNGQTVEVMDRSNSSWYLVSWDGNSGYVYSDFLLLQEEDPSAYVLDSQTGSQGYINGMHVCLRSGPGTSHTILGTYNNGKTLTINGFSGDWTSVSIDGKSGFIYSDYVSEGSPSSAIVQQEGNDSFGGTPITVSTGDVTRGRTTFVLAEPELESSITDTYVVAPPLVESDAAAGETGVQMSDGNHAADALSSTYSTVYVQEQLVPSIESSVPESTSPVFASGSESPLSDHTISDLRDAEITGNGVRLRSGPGTTYSIIGTLDSGTRITIKDSSNPWISVIANGISGYVYSDFVHELSTESQAGSQAFNNGYSASLNAEGAFYQVVDGFITGSNVRLRESPSMSGNILTELNFGNSVKITGLSGDWVRVIYNGQEGFVSSSFVTEGVFEPAPSLSQTTSSNNGTDIAAFALNLVGSPYKWGGSSPATGFDCSGFVQYVFNQFGISVSRTSNDMREDGVHVDPSDLQPGDIICFYSGNNYVGHVGIYVGDDAFVHAANSAVGVVTTPLSSQYYSSRGYEIRRMA